VRTVACGYDHMVVTEAGELWAWGKGAQGRLCLNDTNSRLVPRQLLGGARVGRCHGRCMYVRCTCMYVYMYALRLLGPAPPVSHAQHILRLRRGRSAGASGAALQAPFPWICECPGGCKVPAPPAWAGTAWDLSQLLRGLEGSHWASVYGVYLRCVWCGSLPK
jgi:hypothetical protein